MFACDKRTNKGKTSYVFLSLDKSLNNSPYCIQRTSIDVRHLGGEVPELGTIATIGGYREYE